MFGRGGQVVSHDNTVRLLSDLVNARPAGAPANDGDVIVNNYGQPMDVTTRRDEQGRQVIDLRTPARAAIRDSFASGDAGRAARLAPQPIRR